VKFGVFDIETGPRSREEVLACAPVFKAPANYKDPEKIAAAIKEQEDEFVSRAALCASTGRVVAIGIRTDGVTTILGDEEGERAMLKLFWKWVEDNVRQGRAIIGFNIARFDVPFLIRRSWAVGVRPPSGIIGAYGKLNSAFIDLMQEWQCGDRSATISLARVCALFGLPGKNGNGKDFAALWAENRAAAEEYLLNDIMITTRVAERMLGVVDAEKPTLTLDGDY
jgi:DNA polymerase elongation subunit (family B)